MRDSRHHIASLLKEQLDCDLTSYFLSAAPHECHAGDGVATTFTQNCSEYQDEISLPMRVLSDKEPRTVFSLLIRLVELIKIARAPRSKQPAYAKFSLTYVQFNLSPSM